MIIAANIEAAEYLICIKCISTIEHYWRRLLLNFWKLEEAINAVYLLLSENDYHRLRKYEGRNGATLETYISKIVCNYFLNEAKKEREWREGKYSDMDWDKIIREVQDDSIDEDEKTRKIRAVEETLQRMPNERYKFILQKKIYENKEPEKIAKELGISTDVYYNKFLLAKKQFEQLYSQYYGK